jgi:hypothetical protein
MNSTQPSDFHFGNPILCSRVRGLNNLKALILKIPPLCPECEYICYSLTTDTEIHDVKDGLGRVLASQNPRIKKQAESQLLELPIKRRLPNEMVILQGSERERDVSLTDAAGVK